MPRLEVLSDNKNYVSASHGKSVLSSLADYLIVFVVSFLLFLVAGMPIHSALPSTKSHLNAVSDLYEETSALIEGTHLQERVQGAALSVEESADRYLLFLTKTSYRLNGEDFPYPLTDGTYAKREVPEEETFLWKGTEENPYPNDNVSFYFLHFKMQEASLSSYVYDGADRSEDKEGYLYTSLFGYEASHFESKTDSLPLYQQVKLDEAKTLVDYLVYGDAKTSSVTTTHNSFANCYQKALSTLIREVEDNYAPYIERNEAIQSHYRSYAGGYLVSLTLSYVVAFLIMEGLVQGLLKGRTVAMVFMKLGYAKTNQMEPGFSEFVRKAAVRLVLYYSLTFLVLLLLGNYAFAFSSFGGFQLIFLQGGLALLGIASLVYAGVGKRNQSLSEFAASLNLRDLTTMEAGTPLEERKEDADARKD